MRHSRSYRVISEFHLCIFAVSLFHVSLPGKTEKSAKPITSRLCGYKKDHATDCLNKQFTLRGVFQLQKRYPAIFFFIEVLVPYFNLCKYFFYKSRARNRHSSNDVSLLFLNTIINFHEFFYHKLCCLCSNFVSTFSNIAFILFYKSLNFIV